VSYIATKNEPTADVHPVAGSRTASPEFDRQEINSFGKDDGHAITVIGKMLVLFFFYSLLVMAAVAGWTIWGFGQAGSAPAHHEADTAEF
jgi:hypothetical protein